MSAIQSESYKFMTVYRHIAQFLYITKSLTKLYFDNYCLMGHNGIYYGMVSRPNWL